MPNCRSESQHIFQFEPRPQARPPCARGLTSDSLIVGDGPMPSADDRKRRRALLATLYLGAQRLIPRPMSFRGSGCDMLDECHELIGGDSSAGSDAAYLHAFLHRREGPHVGELGLTGWQNAKYWWGVLGHHELFDELPGVARDTLRDHVGDERAAAFVAACQPASWNPAAFVALCQRALADDDRRLLGFCEAFQLREWERLCARTWAAVFLAQGKFAT